MNKKVSLILFVLLLMFTYSCKKESSFNLLDHEVEMIKGEAYQINYEKVNLDDDVIFEVLDGKIITISSDSVITALESGSTEIYVTCGEFEEVIKVSVKEKTYKITFIGFNNQIINEIDIIENTIPKTPEIPKIEGYKFIKWDSTITKACEDKTYQAIYKKIINVTYELNGGAFENSSNVVNTFIEGAKLNLPTVIKPNYQFVGWSLTNEETSEYLTSLESNDSADLTLYAHYERKKEVDLIYNYNGGYSEKALIINTGINNVPSFFINNYNYNNGKYWDGRYPSDIFIGDKNHDPAATFSERIYIKYNEDYGLYEVVGHIASGASEWLNQADYVISISNSYNSFYASIKPMCNKINIGDMVVFGDSFKTASLKHQVKVAFYPQGSSVEEIKVTVKHDESFETPSRLGYKFLGWYKENDTKVLSPSEVLDDEVITAKWEELSPVTDIVINDFIEKLYTLDTFKINASVVPSNAYFKDILYFSSDTNVATVSSDGTVKAINSGKAVITICDYMKKKTIQKTIEVVSKKTMTIRLSDGYQGVLNPGNSVTVTPTVYGEITNPNFEYKSSNEAIATVQNGVITGVKEGLVDITIKETTSNISLTFGMTIRNLSNETRVDSLIKLLTESHFDTVHVGNACLYDDGTQKVYKPTYGSVNLFTFAEYVVNTKYQAQAESSTGTHKSRNGLGEIEFVTVHDTATLTGSVEAISSYFTGSGGDVSIHYAVGDKEIFAFVPEKYIAYHAGDGTGTKFEWIKTNVKALDNSAPVYGRIKNESTEYLTVNGETTSIVLPSSNPLTILGPVWKIVDGYYYIGGPLWNSTTYGYIGSRGGNNNSIGIEMGVNTTGDIYDTYQRTSQLVADILIRNKLDLTRVKMHNTWSGKNCPQVIIAGGYWDTFMKMVEVQYKVMKDYKDAVITMKSNNPDLVDDTGRVIKQPELTCAVSYEISVTIGETTKTITLNSIIPGTTCFEQWDGTYSSKTIWNNGKFNLDI